MIKLLILSPNLKLPGGVSNYIKLPSNELNREKFEIKYCFIGKSGLFLKDFFYPVLIFFQLIKLKKILKNYKPELIHLNPSLQNIAIFRDFLFLKIVKKNSQVLLLMHGWQENISKKFQSIFWKQYFKKRFEKIDAIVVLANQFRRNLIELGINANKIYVSSPMVESEKYLPEDKNFSGPYKILFCANMIKEKGPFEILEAVPIVLTKFPETKFTFVGSGKDLEILKLKSKKIGIENNVEFTGYISIKEKIRIFKKSHLFVFPSTYSEGFPVVILEAMAAGLPVITTPNAGLADAIENNKQGLILNIKPSSIEVADIIIKLLENPNLMKKMSKNNIKEAKEKYDVKIVTRKIIEIYHLILTENSVC